MLGGLAILILTLLVLVKAGQIFGTWLFQRRKSVDVSNYQTVWRAQSDNQDFWDEVLVGRRITQVIMGETGISEIHLDSGEILMISDGAVVSIEDGRKPFEFFPKKPKAQVA